MAIRIILLLLCFSVLIGCQSGAVSEQPLDPPQHATSDDEATEAKDADADQEDSEPLSQRIRRISPRRYLR